MNSKTIFFIGLILTASGVVSPAVALVAGIAYGFTFHHPYHIDSRNLSHFLLQAAVVALGFGMNLRQVIHAGRAGFFTPRSASPLPCFWGGLWAACSE